MIFLNQNVDQPHFIRQQPIALIFPPVIEWIKFRHLRYFSVLDYSKSTEVSKAKHSARKRVFRTMRNKQKDLF